MALYRWNSLVFLRTVYFSIFCLKFCISYLCSSLKDEFVFKNHCQNSRHYTKSRKASKKTVKKVYYPEQIWPLSQNPGSEWTEYLMYTGIYMFTDLTKKRYWMIFSCPTEDKLFIYRSLTLLSQKTSSASYFVTCSTPEQILFSV